MRFLFDYWTNLKRDACLPASSSVDLRALAPVSGCEALLDVVDDGRDFRSRRFSAAVKAFTGHDLTGQLVSAYAGAPFGLYIVEGTLALYRAAYRRGDAVYVERRLAAVSPHSWYNLMLPLADDAGAVGSFLRGAVLVGPGELPIPMRF